MSARIAHLEGVTGDEGRKVAGVIRDDASSGPSEGVPATGRAVLLDVDAGRLAAITAFENEEDLRRGDDTFERDEPGGLRRPPGMFERADREADRGRGSDGRSGGMT